MIDLGQYSTYTGKNPPQTSTGTTRGPQYEGQQLAYQKSKDKEELYRKNWEQFKDDVDIPREFIASQGASDTINNEINAYFDKWGEAVKSAPNHQLSEDQQLQMKKEKDIIEVKQQKALRDYKEYLEQKKIIEKDQASGLSEYDGADWAAKEEKYLQTGVWDSRPVEYNPVPIRDSFKASKITTANAYTDPKTGTKYSATKEDTVPVITSYILRDSKIRKDAITQWDNLPIEDVTNEDGSVRYGKKHYLDVNKDNKISAEEEQAGKFVPESDNPIVRAYIDDNWKYLVKATPAATKTGGSTTTASASFKTGEVASPQKNQNADYTIQKNVNAYGTSFGTLLNLGRKSFTSDPQTIAAYTDMATGEKKVAGKATRFEVVSYSPDRDMVVVKIVDRVPGLPEGKIIGLDASLYDDLLRGKPFYLDRESLMKQYGTVQTGVIKPKLY
jgi:hypothetical protein